MSTSGITIAELSAVKIWQSALRKIGIIGDNGNGVFPADFANAMNTMNALISEYRALGMAVWKRTTFNLTLVNGVASYTIGTGQTVNTAYPIHLYQVQVESPPYTTQIDVNIISFPDFNMLPNGSLGIPVNVNYQPQINKGILQVWPTPDASVPSGTRLVLTYQAPFEMATPSNVGDPQTVDFPQEWANALIYGMALLLSDEYGVPEQKKVWLEKQADKHLGLALSGGTEDGSMYFQPDLQGS